MPRSVAISVEMMPLLCRRCRIRGPRRRASAQIQSDDSPDLSEAKARCTVEPGGGESCV